MRAHPVRGLLFLLLAAGGVNGILNPPVDAVPDRMTAGDCIYVRTAAAAATGPEARPVGDPLAVEAVINDGKAVRAACGLAHSHEVESAADFKLPVPVASPGASGPPSATQAEVRALVQPSCEAAFSAYVGRPLERSAYMTFAVVPPPEAWRPDSARVLCLVARRDGQQMTGPARNSEE
jgi:hypothetical protein